MAYKWDYTDNGIGVVFEERVIRISNDWALEYYLNDSKTRAFALAVDLRKLYLNRYGTEIRISDRSLAAEIYYHYRLQKRSLEHEKKHGRSRSTRWMLRHMKVIDCGELKNDNNRFVWDIASLFWKRGYK